MGQRIYSDLCLPRAGGVEACTALVLPSALLLKVRDDLRRVLGAAGERLWGAQGIRLIYQTLQSPSSGFMCKSRKDVGLETATWLE